MKVILNRKIEILRLFCNDVDVNVIRIMANDQVSLLQDWVCSNLKNQFKYSTGGTIVDIVMDMPFSGIENGNESEEGDHEKQ